MQEELKLLRVFDRVFEELETVPLFGQAGHRRPVRVGVLCQEALRMGHHAEHVSS